MVWKVRSRVDERMLLISEYLKGERAMTDLCHEFGVSRKTAYKWVARYKADGPAGLADRSRAPLAHPARLDTVVVQALLEARRAHQHWGARKILAWLGRKQPQLERPAASTVSAIFAKYGLSRTRQARRRTPPYTDPFSDANNPNQLWCADFKGDFRTGDGRRCYPLTLTDACSRMLLRCTALPSTKVGGVRPIFERAFREFGLPESWSEYAALTRGPKWFKGVAGQERSVQKEYSERVPATPLEHRALCSGNASMPSLR